MWVGRSVQLSCAAKGWAPIAPINLSLKWSLLLRTYFGHTSQRDSSLPKILCDNSLVQKKFFFPLSLMFTATDSAAHRDEYWFARYIMMSLCVAPRAPHRQGHVRHLLCSAGPLLLLKAANFNETLFTAVAFWYIFGIHMHRQSILGRQKCKYRMQKFENFKAEFWKQKYSFFVCFKSF